MATETLLTLAMMGAVVVAFLVLHVALRRVPYETTAPREGWQWPVWSWFPLVLAFGILFGLAGNLYWNARTPETVPVLAEDDGWEPVDIHPVKGKDD